VNVSHGACGNLLDHDAPGFLQPPRLAPEAVELVRARQHAQRPRGLEARVDARDEFVGVRRERHLARIRQPEQPRYVILRFRHHLAEDALPLAVGERGRVAPVARVRALGRVGPGMVAVCGEMQPPRIGGAEFREELVEHFSFRKLPEKPTQRRRGAEIREELMREFGLR
jgi:hypothetical protein